MEQRAARLRALNRQIQRLQRRIERLNRVSQRYAWLRLGLFLLGLASAGASFYAAGAWLAGGVLLAWSVPFGVLVRAHRQIDAGIERHRVWLRIKSAHVARIGLDWGQIPTTFGQRPRPEHPFASDLDIVGDRSLYRLIDTAVSFEGSQRLQEWLTDPLPRPERSLERQRLVRELASLTLFRDKLALYGTLNAGTRKTWDAGRLVAWLERHAPDSTLRGWVIFFGGWVLLNLLLFILHRLGWTGPVWVLSLILYLGAVMARGQTTKTALDQALALQDELAQLSAVFGHLERFSYRRTPHLRRLCGPFTTEGQRPSQHLARMTRQVAALGLRENPAVWFLLNAVSPWDAFFALRVNQCKVDLSERAPVWLELWFELEALSSLANLAYLNPDYTFPTLLTGEVPPSVFRAQGLGHPLIPQEARVCNDFALGELGRIGLITGSNMAGKTVFLKTVGLNLALANAGGPVAACVLETVPFRLFTSMRVSDSVIDGISYFYAEVKRLRGLLSALEAEQALPLFFFIDEIFRGTNNRERLIGSRSYVGQLVDRHGVGLIATHDLELTRLADRTPRIDNYHFRDQVEEGRMTYDYVLRPGPSPTTNALKIMALEGLLPAQQPEARAASKSPDQ